MYDCVNKNLGPCSCTPLFYLFSTSHPTLPTTELGDHQSLQASGRAAFTGDWMKPIYIGSSGQVVIDRDEHSSEWESYTSSSSVSSESSSGPSSGSSNSSQSSSNSSGSNSESSSSSTSSQLERAYRFQNTEEDSFHAFSEPHGLRCNGNGSAIFYSGWPNTAPSDDDQKWQRLYASTCFASPPGKKLTIKLFCDEDGSNELVKFERTTQVEGEPPYDHKDTISLNGETFSRKFFSDVNGLMQVDFYIGKDNDGWYVSTSYGSPDFYGFAISAPVMSSPKDHPKNIAISCEDGPWYVYGLSIKRAYRVDDDRGSEESLSSESSENTTGESESSSVDSGNNISSSSSDSSNSSSSSSSSSRELEHEPYAYCPMPTCDRDDGSFFNRNQYPGPVPPDNWSSFFPNFKAPFHHQAPLMRIPKIHEDTSVRVTIDGISGTGYVIDNEGCDFIEVCSYDMNGAHTLEQESMQSTYLSCGYTQQYRYSKTTEEGVIIATVQTSGRGYRESKRVAVLISVTPTPDCENDGDLAIFFVGEYGSYSNSSVRDLDLDGEITHVPPTTITDEMDRTVIGPTSGDSCDQLIYTGNGKVNLTIDISSPFGAS